MTTAPADLLPDYATLAAALSRCGLRHGPAEVHGLACGLYAAAIERPRDVWRDELYAEFDPADVLASECRDLLERVFDAVFDADQAQMPGLTLLLPQQLVVDSTRLAALRDWCQGFLFGLGLGGSAPAARLSPASREWLHDVAEITRIDTEDADDNAANQAALIEIEEYLRTGVMLVCDELRGADPAGSDDPVTPPLPQE